MERQLILSTDPGIDDALAIIFLSKLNVLEAVWTTMGNNTLEICTTNVMKLLDMVGRPDIPIIRGAAQPLTRKFEIRTAVHGLDGLGNTNLLLPERSRFIWKDLNYIIASIKEQPQKITLVSVGPLTNIALLLQKSHETIISLIKEIVIMGGAINWPGNVTPYSEFNVWADPHAAQMVFQSGLPIILVPLDVTEQTILTEAHLEVLAAEKTSLTEFIVKIARYYSKFHRPFSGCFMHDPLAAAIAIDSSLATKKKMAVDVITDQPLKIGQTVIPPIPRNIAISVCLEVNTDKFFDLFLNTLLK